MATIICEHCNAEIEIPATYTAPYIRCNVCGTHLKTGKPIPRIGNKFNVKSIEDNLANGNAVKARPASASNYSPKPVGAVSGKTVANPSNSSVSPAVPSSLTTQTAQTVQTSQVPQVSQAPSTPSSNSVPSADLEEKSKRALDAMGEKGMKKAMALVADYICLTSPKARAAGRAKAIRLLMQEKYPISAASRAIEYAESSPEALAMGKAKNIKKSVILAAAVALGVAGLLAFL